MVERASWATMNGESGRIVDVEDARLALGALWTPGAGGASARPGIRPAGGNPGQVTASAPTPDTNVHVRAFQGVLGASRGVGPYTTTLDADKQLDVLVAHPADPSNPRNDLVVEVQTDTFYNDPSTAYEVKLIVGDPAASPIDPTAKITSPDYRILARVRVAAGATAITDAAIDNFPHDWTVALGGVLPVPDQAARDAIGNPYGGFTIWRVDRAWQEVHDGSAWRVQGVAICSSTADRDTAITSPRSGQLCQTTDNDVLWQFDGATSSWIQLAGTGLPRGRVAQSVRTDPSATYAAPTVLWTVTFTSLGTGRLYDVRINSGWSGTASTSAFELRWKAGTSLDATIGNNTVAWAQKERFPNNINNGFDRLRIGTTISGLASGTVTLGLVGINGEVGGSALLGSADNQRIFEVWDGGS